MFYFTLPTVPPPPIQADRPVRQPAPNSSVLVLTNRSGSGERLRDAFDPAGASRCIWR